MWGWSYGGYLSLKVLTKDTGNVFRCGASVAPVADWTLYDTYYTERYMGSLDENAAGYNQSKVFWGLEALRKKPYFLLHGTHDDNVHYQNSMLIR
jgi:dipeptidyl-peptidase-4